MGKVHFFASLGLLLVARSAAADGALEPLPPPEPTPTPAQPTSASTPSVTATATEPPAITFTLCNAPDTKPTSPLSTECAGVFGLRGSGVSVTGAHASEGVGLMFSAEGEEFWHRGIWSSRGQYGLALGGGGAGLEGELLGDFTFGFRAPVTAQQGPIVRAGAAGHMMGDDAFYSSLVELPRLEAGWQWSRGHAVAEIAATTGVVLTGRYHAGDAATRDLGQGFAYGARASLQVPWVRLSLEGERLPSNDAIPLPVDVAFGTLCAVAAPMAICVDARAEAARAFVEGTEPRVTALYAGFTLGFTGER